MDKQEAFIKRLLATFQTEAHEHIQTVSSGLMKLESAPESERAALVESVFRAMHSLKGAARAVNRIELETACHLLENIFAQWKNHGAPADPGIFDALHKTSDLLVQLVQSAGNRHSNTPGDRDEEMLQEIKIQLQKFMQPGGSTEVSAAPTTPPGVQPVTAHDLASGAFISQQISRLEQIRNQARAGMNHVNEAPASGETDVPLKDNASPTPPPATRSVVGSMETIRVSTHKLDHLLIQTEELLATKQAASHMARHLPQLQTLCNVWYKEWNRIQSRIRTAEKILAAGQVDGKTDAIQQLFEFLEWNGKFMESLSSELGKATQTARGNHRSSSLLIDNVIEEMKKVLMRPVISILEGMPRITRDLARDLGKDVELSIRCAEIEMDRRILEELKDPLLHLIRNSVDHGIEKPQDRIQKGKAPKGLISITLIQLSGREVELIISDDGSGMDLEHIRSIAVEKGLILPEEAEHLNETQTISLVFQSGFSTSSIITDLSGRGLGLAIVQEKIEKLGGRIHVKNSPGLGVGFHIRLPTTRATFRGVVVRVGDETLVFPTASVERVVRLKKEQIRMVENQETVKLTDALVALVRLSDVLGIEISKKDQLGDAFPAVVVAANGQTIAFVVNEVVNEHEVLIKSLGSQLLRVRNVEGATVLEGGRLAPILHVSDLMKSAASHPKSGSSLLFPASADASTVHKKILVVEDSITSRTLLKNILESSHYQVKTAVDGMDGFAKLHEDQFDLVVSDVEMPRLHGFDLTARIRADKLLSALPVILVTARETPEDREKGIEVGANAYIVKSSFDQSNLLEVVQRLI